MSERPIPRARTLSSLSKEEKESIIRVLKWAVQAEKTHGQKNPERRSKAPEGSFSLVYYQNKIQDITGFYIKKILDFGFAEKVFSVEEGTGNRLEWVKPIPQKEERPNPIEENTPPRQQRNAWFRVSPGTRDESLPHASFASSEEAKEAEDGNRAHVAKENANVHSQSSADDRDDGGCSIQDILDRNAHLEKLNELLLKRNSANLRNIYCLQKQNEKASSAIIRLQLALQEAKEKEELAIAQAEFLRIQIKELTTTLGQKPIFSFQNCSIDASFHSNGGGMGAKL